MPYTSLRYFNVADGKRSVLHRGGAVFAGSDADDFLDRLDPNLAVADGSGAGGVADDLDNAIDVLVGADKGELHLRNRIDE